MEHAAGAKALGLTFNEAHQLHRWRAAGAVTPSIRDADGSGTRVEWSDFDFERLHCVFDLYDQFHAENVLLPYTVVADCWETLGRHEPWSLCFGVELS